jgi:hypothetical protein
MKRYSRLIVLFGGAFACVAINFWLIRTGQYRWPLVVFVVYLVGVSVVIRKLPPVTRDTEEIRGHQFKASRAARRMGWIYVAGLVLGTLNFLSGGANGIPWWGIVLAMGWSLLDLELFLDCKTPKEGRSKPTGYSSSAKNVSTKTDAAPIGPLIVENIATSLIDACQFRWDDPRDPPYHFRYIDNS